MIFFSSAAIVIIAAAPTAAFHTKKELLTAIHQVESGGKSSAPNGDHGKAIGPLQIHKECWKDATDFDSRIGGKYEDCRKLEYAKKIFDAYLRRHAKRYFSDRMTPKDAEKCSRIWNQGPRGAERKAGEVYWLKVKKHLTRKETK